MCTASCLDFVRRHLRQDEVGDRTVLEVGALDVNGSVRSFVCALRPKRYVGVDLKARKPIDFVMNEPKSHELFSIIASRRVMAVTDCQIAAFHRRGQWQRIIRAPERFVRRWRPRVRS
jgi:hypothetical protein